MRKIAILLISLMVISVGFLSGCNEELNGEESNDDESLISWIYDINDAEMEYSSDIIDAMSNKQWELLEYHTDSLETIIDDEWKGECLAFTLSYVYDEIRDEYYEYLVDRSLSVFYLGLGAIYMQIEFYENAEGSF